MICLDDDVAPVAVDVEHTINLLVDSGVRELRHLWADNGAVP